MVVVQERGDHPLRWPAEDGNDCSVARKHWAMARKRQAKPTGAARAMACMPSPYGMAEPDIDTAATQGHVDGMPGRHLKAGMPDDGQRKGGAALGYVQPSYWKVV